MREYGVATRALVLAVLLVFGQDDARIFNTGDLGARHEALARILAIAPGNRTADVWEALKQEVERLVACLDVVPPSPAARQSLQCEIAPRAEDDYLPELITAIGQSRDPSMIPTLIKVVPSGAIAADALMRFGDLAVAPLIESAMSSRSGPWVEESGGATLALSRMLEQPAAATEAISGANRSRITQTARTLFDSRLTATNQIAIVALALATKDAALRSEVEALATNAFEWQRRGVVDQTEIARAQRSIRYQLTRYPNR